MSLRRVALATVATCAVLEATAQATPGPPPAAPPGAKAAPTWIVGGDPTSATRRAARAHGARLLSPLGIYVLPRVRAHAFAGALKAAGTYRFAEPDVRAQTIQTPPIDDFAATDWRTPLIAPSLLPPAPEVTPLIAIVDTPIDISHPDLAGMQSSAPVPAYNFHGTAVASLIGGRANGVGIVGVLPGARVLAIGVDKGLRTSDLIAGVSQAVTAGARVINMSFALGRRSPGLALVLAKAVSDGVLPVAGAGNDRLRLSGVELGRVVYPAAYPHVLSVSSIGPNGASSRFSTSNGAVDVAAPGESVLAAVPAAFDTDGVADGYMRLDGTSFAGPIVAAAAAWLIAARPTLSSGQVADVLRFTADDIGDKGWDPDTGWGRINLSEALKGPAPDDDAKEVDDDIGWVNGKHLGQPYPFVFTGRRNEVSGTLDIWEDRGDVHRIRVPGRSRVRVTLQVAKDENPNLAVFTPAARSIYGSRGRVGRSFRAVGRSERLVIANGSRRPVARYVAVLAPRNDDDAYMNASYTLRFQRLGTR